MLPRPWPPSPVLANPPRRLAPPPQLEGGAYEVADLQRRARHRWTAVSALPHWFQKAWRSLHAVPSPQGHAKIPGFPKTLPQWTRAQCSSPRFHQTHALLPGAISCPKWKAGSHKPNSCAFVFSRAGERNPQRFAEAALCATTPSHATRRTPRASLPTTPRHQQDASLHTPRRRPSLSPPAPQGGPTSSPAQPMTPPFSTMTGATSFAQRLTALPRPSPHRAHGLRGHPSPLDLPLCNDTSSPAQPLSASPFHGPLRIKAALPSVQASLFSLVTPLGSLRRRISNGTSKSLTTGQAALFRCKPPRSQNGSRSFPRRLVSTWKSRTSSRLRPLSRAHHFVSPAPVQASPPGFRVSHSTGSLKARSVSLGPLLALGDTGRAARQLICVGFAMVRSVPSRTCSKKKGRQTSKLILLQTIL